MIRNAFVLACLTASVSFSQGLTATSPLVPLPAATFGGTGIPNGRVAVVTITDGPNTITLGLNATARFAAPPVTDNGLGTFFATPGPGTSPNLALWNFNFYVLAVNSTTGANALPSYAFDLLYDMNPGSFTSQGNLGRVAVGPAFDGGPPTTGTIQNSQNLGFGYLRVAIPGILTPPLGYANPGGIPFDPNALGHYTFALRAFNLAGAPLGQSVIHVSTSGVTIPSPELSYQLRYLANLNVGDSVINITNSGARGAGLAAGTSSSTTGAICVNVYAFSPDEQLVSCCSCPVTPNGLVSLSARRDLISNTLTPTVPTSLVVKLVSSIPQTGSAGCAASAATVLPLNVVPGPGQLATGMHAWATTFHAGAAGAGPAVTESAFAPATLSVGPVSGGFDVGELVRLTQLCTFINANGSGFGICGSCRMGGLGAGRL